MFVKFKDIAKFKYGTMISKFEKEGFPVFSGYQFTGYTNSYMYDDEKVLILCRGVGGTGKTALAPKKTWITNLSIIVEENSKIVNYKYLYYYLSTQFKRLRKLDTGSCQSQITIESLNDFLIYLPLKEIQNKIASVISLLDIQINRNKAMVKRLQVLGKTIYSQYVHSSNIVKLCTISSITTGKEDANHSTENGKYKFFTCSDDVLLCDDYKFDGKSVLVAGNGNFNVKFYDGKFNAYQRTYVIKNDTIIGNLYYTLLFNTELFKKQANGSIVKFITINMLNDINVPLFDSKINKTLNRIVIQINSINNEIHNLNKLKDEILPLLINQQLI